MEKYIEIKYIFHILRLCKLNKDTKLNHFTYNSFTELLYLSYLHWYRIKVLSYLTYSTFGISHLNMLTRSSDWIFNPMRYADNILIDTTVDTALIQLGWSNIDKFSNLNLLLLAKVVSMIGLKDLKIFWKNINILPTRIDVE